MENMQLKQSLYLTLKGIPAGTSEGLASLYFTCDSHGVWYPNKGNYLYEIDTICVRIHDSLAERIFGSLDKFYNYLSISPEYLSKAGMNSESLVSKNSFKQKLEKVAGNVEINKALYLFDCQKLVSGIQECSKEVMYLQGEFYHTLNLEELFYPDLKENDGVRYITSPAVTKLYALLGFVYIRMYSLLDYVTKLAIEIESLKTQFDSYSRLVSKNSQYGDRKKISLNNYSDSLFEQCTLLTEIESVRHHLIHDGLLDDMPKVYEVISSGQCIEKYLLFPDQTTEGRFESFKNRNLFYSGNNKINYRLPDVTKEFQKRLLLTLGLLLDKINS